MMARITTSILPLLLLASSSLAASSNQYERSGDDIIVARKDLYDLFGREVVDYLEEREPLNHAAIHHAVHAARRVGHGLDRAYEIHDQIQSAMNNRRELADEELRVREDLVSREPFGFGAAFKFAKGLKGLAHKHKSGGKKAFHHGGDSFNNQDNQQQRRDLDDVEDILGREFDEEYDLLERDYYDDLD